VTDVHDKHTRSYNMSQIKSKNTKPELLVRKFLFANGFRYKLHDKKLPGKPDIVLPKLKTALFVHGCYWHGHNGCRFFVTPKTRTAWWLGKIEKNRKNDIIHTSELHLTGWRVIVIWECQLKPSERDKTLHGLLKMLKK